MTDFFIWTNYNVNVPRVDNISLNYLSTLLMQVAGIPLTEYQLFLTNMYNEYPVLTTAGIRDAQGNYLGGTDILEGKDIWNYYTVLEYNNVFEDDDRYAPVYDWPFGMAQLLDPDMIGGGQEEQADAVPPESSEHTMQTEESEVE